MSTANYLNNCRQKEIKGGEENKLSVHQLVTFHSGCQVHKVRNTKLAVYHCDRLFETDGNVERIKSVHVHVYLEAVTSFTKVQLFGRFSHVISKKQTQSQYSRKIAQCGIVVANYKIYFA